MKANLFSVMAIPALVLASASAFAVTQGDTGNVTFTGTIGENTCTIDDDSLNKKVIMEDVQAGTLSREGSVSAAKGFSIGLKDCSPVTATITFSGDHETDTALKVSGTQPATNVGIQILENGAPLKVDGSASSSQKLLTAGVSEFNFAARYVALANNVTSGDANATAQFTVNYE